MTAAPANEARVELVWIEGRTNHWIRFGHWYGERVHSRSHRTVAFPVGAVFAYLRWQANDYGTVGATFVVIRVVRPGEPAATYPGVDPGGELLLSVHGWARVQRVLDLIDQVEARKLDPSRIATAYWRHVHNRIAAGQSCRSYTHEQHRAWELRKEFAP